MNTGPYIAILAIAATTALARGYRPGVLLPVLAVSALVLAIPWYLGNRDRSQPLSPAERAVALWWVWSRRIVCVGTGLLCFALAGTPLVVGLQGESYMKGFVWVFGFLAAGVVVVCLGIFGYPARFYGDNRGARQARLANKKRYGLRL